MVNHIKITVDFQLPVLQYLYENREKNIFVDIPQELLLSIDNKHKVFGQLFELAHCNLVTFQNLPAIYEPTWSFVSDYESEKPRYEDFRSIRARIEVYGIIAVEKYMHEVSNP